MRFVTIPKKGAARRVPGQSPRRAEAKGVCSVRTGVGRGRFGIRRHSQAFAGTRKHLAGSSSN
jgi:hypothetical protein